MVRAAGGRRRARRRRARRRRQARRRLAYQLVAQRRYRAFVSETSAASYHATYINTINIQTLSGAPRVVFFLGELGTELRSQFHDFISGAARAAGMRRQEDARNSALPSWQESMADLSIILPIACRLLPAVSSLEGSLNNISSYYSLCSPAAPGRSLCLAAR